MASLGTLIKIHDRLSPLLDIARFREQTPLAGWNLVSGYIPDSVGRRVLAI